MAIWSTQAANVIINCALKDERALTHMQIQKLVYIAHGWSLRRSDKRLTLDDPEAWKHGPIYRLLWDRLNYAGQYPIGRTIPKSYLLPHTGARKNELEDREYAQLESVYIDYGSITGPQLSLLTHDGNTPWRQIYRNGKGKNEPIPDYMIKEHFGELVQRYVRS